MYRYLPIVGFFLFFLVVILLSIPTFANDPTPRLGILNPSKSSYNWEDAWYGFTAVVDGMASDEGTFASRPACSSAYRTQLYVVSNCLTDLCTVGGGTIQCLTRCNTLGTTWETLMCGVSTP